MSEILDMILEQELFERWPYAGNIPLARHRETMCDVRWQCVELEEQPSIDIHTHSIDVKRQRLQDVTAISQSFPVGLAIDR